MKHEEIVARLKAEALDEPDTGWVSDLSHHELEWNDDNTIVIYNKSRPWEPSGLGSIDVGQLAGIVEALIKEANDG